MIFAVLLSASCNTGLSGTLELPHIRVVRANLQPADASWYPAGPAMDTLLETATYVSLASEFVDLQGANSQIDFADGPLTSNLVPSFTQNPALNVTQPQWTGFNEIEFNLANIFWGCAFNFGNTSSTCGTYIRQGIAHLVDKTIFVNQEPEVKGVAAAIDNPLSAGATLPTPVSCSWDTHFQESGPNCIVGGTKPGDQTYTGGTAYHLSSAAGVCVPSPLGGCNFISWMQSNPSPDFCAGAYDISIGVDLILGPAGGGFVLRHQPGGTFPNGPPSSWKFDSSTDCHLWPVGDPGVDWSVVSSYPVNFFIRTDNPALDYLGASYAEEICAVWSGTFTLGCNKVPLGNYGLTFMNILDVTSGNILAFPGYLTSTGSNPTTNWSIYTSGASGYVPSNPFDVNNRKLNLGGEPTKTFCHATGCDPFDINLYFTFNSQQVSGIPSIKPPCLSQTVSLAASNYMYLCSNQYDTASTQMESANCLAANYGTDPSPGQTTPTFGTCNSGGLSALSAGYQAEDIFGKGAYTIPAYTLSVQYGFLGNNGVAGSGWRSVINAAGTFNYFNFLNAWNPSSAQPGTIREGLSSPTISLNPYVASSPTDFAILGNIYDSLTVADPYDDGAVINWMTISSLTPAITYEQPPGTVLTYRFTLMPNLSFQDGTPVTAFDVAFSYLSLLGTGSMLGGTLASLSGITVLSSTQFDLNLKTGGPFVLSSVTSVPILPGVWWTSSAPGNKNGKWINDFQSCVAPGSSCFPAQYMLSPTAKISNSSIAAPVCALNCNIFPAKDLYVNPDMTVANFDPVAHNVLIGSGPWQCGHPPVQPGTPSCTASHDQSGPSYTFIRYGIDAFPGTAGDYFRSSAFLATYLWSGDITPGPGNFSAAKACFQVTPLAPLSATPPAANSCAHWQQGIGTNGATSAPGTNGCPGAPNTTPCGIPVGSNQMSIVRLYINIGWVWPWGWNTATPPPGIIGLNPILHEGGQELDSAYSVGCSLPFPKGGYDC